MTNCSRNSRCRPSSVFYFEVFNKEPRKKIYTLDPPYTQTHTQTHTHKSTHTHKQIDTHTHTHPHPNTHTSTSTHTRLSLLCSQAQFSLAYTKFTPYSHSKAATHGSSNNHVVSTASQFCKKGKGNKKP